MIPIDLECDRLSMIVFFLQSFQVCFFFKKRCGFAMIDMFVNFGVAHW